MLYFYCAFEGCKEFKATIGSFETAISKLKVWSLGEFNDHSHKHQKLCRNLSGEERKKVSEKLQSQSSSVYRSKMTNDICGNPEKLAKFLENGNLQEAKSSQVFRKTKSEYKSVGDFASDVFQDLVLCYSKKLITSLSLPLKIEIINERYMEVLRKNQKKTLYFDATGSLMYKSNI